MIPSEAWLAPWFSLLRLCVVEALRKIDGIFKVMLVWLQRLQPEAVFYDAIVYPSDWAFVAFLRLIVHSEASPEEEGDSAFWHFPVAANP